MNDFDPPQDGSEKKIILFILATLAAYWVWATYMAPKAPPPSSSPPQTHSQPVETSRDADARPEDPSPEMRATPEEATLDPDAAFKPTGKLPENRIDLLTSHWKGVWSTQGGAVQDMVYTEFEGSTEVTPVYTWVYRKARSLVGAGEAPAPWKPYGDYVVQRILQPEGRLVTAGGIGTGWGSSSDDSAYEIVSSGSKSMEFRRVGSDGLEIVKRYELLEDPFLARVTVSWRNLGARPLSGDLWVGMENAEHLDAGRYSNERRPQAFVEGSFLEISDVKKLASKPTEKEGPLTWFGEGNRYFLTALLPADPNLGALRVTATGNRVHVTQVVRGITLEPGATRVAEYTLFAGPKRSNILKNVGFNVDKSVQYGWFGFFARILLWLLQQFHRVTQNWGLAIILLTVFVKLVFYPLTQKSYRSSKEMQRIQPLMNEIKQKYKDKPDLQNQETMKLLQEHKVNPLGGCLPTLVQLPVWMALYSVLLNSVDLYHSRFLFYTDLSAQDPYAILPILVGVLMFVQQRITPMTGMDPTQAKMMQFMPLVFCFFIFSFPSGLGLYILVNSILSIAQQKLIDRSYKKSMA